MASSKRPDHYVVDGSNIATEGRSLPSLEQLNEAVLAFKAQNPEVIITVVVDATFGHRINKKEAKAFDEAIANNELVAPPAGAVGRGDAFVLAIAHQANAGVLSNDSFQEFHGEYGWLFDDGRLVGGKPVPNVGWIFVDRSPVRGPKSRQSIKEAKSDSSGDRQAEKRKASTRVRRKSDQGDDTPAESTSKRRSSRSGAKKSDSSGASSKQSGSKSDDSFVNGQMEFIEFVSECPVGTRLKAVVDSYSSHGAYAAVGSIQLYVPLRYIADPAPRSAKKHLTVGDEVELVIVGFTPDRRSIDAALPDMAQFAMEQEHNDPASISDTTIDATDRLSAGSDDDSDDQSSEKPAKRGTAKKSTAKKSTAKKSTAKKSTAKKSTAKKSTAKKSTAKKSSGGRGAAKTTATDRSDNDGDAKQPTKRGTAKKSAAKKSTATKTTAKKAPAKKSTAKKSTANKSTAKKSTAKKTTAKKAPAKKSSTKKAPAKQSARKNTATAPAAKQARDAKPAAAANGPSKVRVHELAKELGRSNAEVLSLCEQLGLSAKSHASSLTAEHAQLVRTALGNK